MVCGLRQPLKPIRQIRRLIAEPSANALILYSSYSLLRNALKALVGGTMPAVVNEPVTLSLDAHERLLIDQAIAKHRDRPGAMLGILEAVQSANPHKFLSMESLRYIADETGVPPASIYSAATFYALFNLDPQGDNVICVCRGTACHTRGSRDLLAKVCLDLGLNTQQPTAPTKPTKCPSPRPIASSPFVPWPVSASARWRPWSRSTTTSSVTSMSALCSAKSKL